MSTLQPCVSNRPTVIFSLNIDLIRCASYYREDEFRIHCAKPHESDDGVQVDEPAGDTDADGESDVAVVKDDSDSPVYRRRLDEDYDGPEDHITADAQVDTESVNQDINTWNARTGNLAEAQSELLIDITVVRSAYRLS